MDLTTRRELLAAVGTGLFGAVSGCADFGLRNGESTPPVPSEGTMGARNSSADRSVTADTTHPTVRVEGGTYTIGTDEGPEDARPAHGVSISTFRIDKYEVTNAQFGRFLDALDVEPVSDAPPGGVTSDDVRSEDAHLVIEGPEGEENRPLVALDDEHARIGISGDQFVVQDGYEDHPVTEASWIGAREFARWRGARLPTEAEWEAAARGREGRLYPWGDAAPTHEHAVYGRDSGDTAPVGTHPRGATPSGIHDMAGNVSEWTSSLYWPYPYDADDGRENPRRRGERVTRGGAHVFYGPKELRAYYRTGFSREFDRGHRHIGFRCVRCPAEDQ